MSTKSSVWNDENVYLYEEAQLEGESPAYLEAQRRFKVDMNNEAYQCVTVEIEPEAMDRLAQAWLKHRGLV